MGQALEAVLQLKAAETARAQQQSDNLTEALKMLQNAQQNVASNRLAQLQQAQTAKYQDAQVNNFNLDNIRQDNLVNAQIKNYESQAQARKGQELISNLIKGSQLKKAGQDTKDKSIYDSGDILIKSSLGLPASVNQYMGDVGKISPPISLNAKESNIDPNLDLQTQASETDWTGNSTPRALEAKRKLELQTKQDEQNIKDKADIEKNKEVEKNRLASEQSFSQDMLSSIGEVEKGIKYFGAAGAIPPLPGEYDKVNWQANFDKIISQNVLQTMKDLKSQSKTGSTGFGQLSNKELGILMNASTVLKKNMSEEDAKRYLTQMKDTFKKISGDKSNNTNEGKTSTGLKYKVIK